MTTARHRLTAAAVTAAAGLLAWLLAQGPLADRVAEPDTCGIPADCLADPEIWRSVAAAIGLAALSWAIVILAILGLTSVALGHAIARRWPEVPAARVGAALLTYSPPLILGTVAVGVTLFAYG